MAKAGIGFAERQHITDESLKLAVRYKNVTQASVMELWKEMRSVVTHPHEVDAVIEPMVRAKSLLDAKDKTGTASHGLNLLVKGAEAIGAAKDPERFNKLLDGYVRAMQVMGSTITPEGIYEMQKYSKTSGGRWSDRFIMTTAQSLGQELGGSTAGNSIDVATRQIVGGMQNLHSKAKEFARVGLIDRKNLDILKTGEVKGTKAGVKHAVKGDDLAASDLDQWVYTVLLPHLEKAGIKSESDQMAWVQKNFTGTGANVVAKLIQQRESFEAHAHNYHDALGTAGVDLNRSDPNAGMGAVSKSLETFLGVLSSPMMVQAAHALDSISAGIGSWSLKIDEFNKAHPDIAKFEAPVAAGAGLAGAGLASAAVYNALSSGFGLKTSAAALDHSAILLDAAAIRLSGGTVPDTVKSMATAGAPALAGFGLGGIVAGTAIGAGVAIGATMQEMPKVMAEKGAIGVDPATGGAFEANPMEGLGPEKPWLRNWITSLFTTPGASEETGKKLGEDIGKGIVDAPLPPRRPAMLDDFKEKATETGTEAGKTLLQRIIEAVGTGINIPINFVPGDGSGGGGSGIQKASFGGGGSFGGGIQRASFGSGAGGGAGGGSGLSGIGGGIPRFGGGAGRGVGGAGGSFGGGGSGAGLAHARGVLSRANPEMVAYIREAAIRNGIDPNIALRIAASEGLGGSIPGVRMTPGDNGTSFGPFQLHYGGRGSLGTEYTRATGHHAGDPQHWKEQIDFALGYAGRKKTWAPWFGRGPAGVGTREGFNYKGGPVAPKTADGEPHLIKGLDGKEGLDLGNGTMKMPDGSIRSITRSGLEIPDPPAGGIGGGTGSKADLQAAADRMHAAAEKFENAGFHGQIEVTGLRRSGLRATSIKMRGRGGLTADMGISEPGAKEDLSDWS
ncbi:hypothetical protein [Methylobacterium pseudosasicola]|nr:hypothetical protein [Methylobacterium pseudosasicola]